MSGVVYTDDFAQARIYHGKQVTVTQDLRVTETAIRGGYKVEVVQEGPGADDPTSGWAWWRVDTFENGQLVSYKRGERRTT